MGAVSLLAPPTTSQPSPVATAAVDHVFSVFPHLITAHIVLPIAIFNQWAINPAVCLLVLQASIKILLVFSVLSANHHVDHAEQRVNALTVKLDIFYSTNCVLPVVLRDTSL